MEIDRGPLRDKMGTRIFHLLDWESGWKMGFSRKATGLIPARDLKLYFLFIGLYVWL